ncbi:MAG: asparagine synthase C-terminal domain-containing protein [Pseudomonadota bacterium]
MTVSLQARRKPTEYFSFDIEAEKASKPEAKRLDDYCTAFDRAVKRRLRSAYPMGAEISGGLDSGGIVAYAVPHLRDTLADFKGFGFAMYEHDAQAMQETAMHLNIPFMYVQTSQQLKLDDNEGYCAPPVLGVAPRFDTQGYYNFMLSSARSVGIRTLLSGYGGDEIVTAIAPRIAWAEAFRARDFAKLYAMSSGSGPRRLVEFARNARRGWRYELDAKRHLRNEAFFPTSLLSVEAAEQYGVLDIYREEQKALAEARTFNQVCLGRTKFRRGLAGRLERTALKANTFGVEFRYPMFDRELMVQVLRTPTVNLFEKGVQRSLHRKAISSHLPSRVFAVQKNQMGSQLAPFHWDLLLKMAPQVPTVSSELEEFIDQEKLKYLEEKLAMSSNEHAKLSFQKKAATVMDYHKLKMLDYWLRVS